jgi:hypothetical protein
MTARHAGMTCTSPPAMRRPAAGFDAGDLSYWGSNRLLIRRNPSSAFYRATPRTSAAKFGLTSGVRNERGKGRLQRYSPCGVTWTLLDTLYRRAWEGRLPHPILGDHYAAEPIERIDYDFAKLKRRVRPNGNQSVVGLPARQLDDWGGAFESYRSGTA